MNIRIYIYIYIYIYTGCPKKGYASINLCSSETNKDKWFRKT